MPWFFVFVCLTLLYFLPCDSKYAMPFFFLNCLPLQLACYVIIITSSLLPFFQFTPVKTIKKKLEKKKFNFAFTSTQKLKFYNSLIFSRWLNEKCCLLHHSSSPFMWRKYGDMKRSRRWQDKTIRFFSVVELTKKIFKKFIVVQNNNNNNYNSLINWYKWNFF